MASMNKITDIIAAIKTIYPYYAKDTDIEVLAKTWNALLKDFPDEAVDMALYKCLQICKMPPTPAEVIEQITSMHRSIEQSDEELWSLYCEAMTETARQMSRFTYSYIDETGISQGQQARNKVDDIWEGLPEKIKRYLATKGELMRNARLSNDDFEFLSWEKQRFMKSMPIMEKRIEYSGLMLEGERPKFLLD